MSHLVSKRNTSYEMEIHHNTEGVPRGKDSIMMRVCALFTMESSGCHICKETTVLPSSCRVHVHGFKVREGHFKGFFKY